MQGLRSEGRAPRLIVIENVVGLLTSHDGKDFAAICDALADAGYRFGAVVIDAAAFVPQSRVRVFIVAIDTALSFPAGVVDGMAKPLAPSVAAHGKLSPEAQDAWLWWRLPSAADAKHGLRSTSSRTDPPGVSLAHASRDGSAARNDVADQYRQGRGRTTRAGKRMVGGLYRRMRDEAAGRVQRAEVRFDDVAGCLRVPTGGSSRQTIMIVEGDSTRSRLLSPREAARLMGLPDSYKLPADYNEAYGLMGDGVVAPVVRFLAQHILEPLLAEARKIQA